MSLQQNRENALDKSPKHCQLKRKLLLLVTSSAHRPSIFSLEMVEPGYKNIDGKLKGVGVRKGALRVLRTYVDRLIQETDLFIFLPK